MSSNIKKEAKKKKRVSDREDAVDEPALTSRTPKPAPSTESTVPSIDDEKAALRRERQQQLELFSQHHDQRQQKQRQQNPSKNCSSEKNRVDDEKAALRNEQLQVLAAVQQQQEQQNQQPKKQSMSREEALQAKLAEAKRAEEMETTPSQAKSHQQASATSNRKDSLPLHGAMGVGAHTVSVSNSGDGVTTTPINSREDTKSVLQRQRQDQILAHQHRQREEALRAKLDSAKRGSEELGEASKQPPTPPASSAQLKSSPSLMAKSHQGAMGIGAHAVVPSPVINEGYNTVRQPQTASDSMMLRNPYSKKQLVQEVPPLPRPPTAAAAAASRNNITEGGMVRDYYSKQQADLMQHPDSSAVTPNNTEIQDYLAKQQQMQMPSEIVDGGEDDYDDDDDDDGIQIPMTIEVDPDDLSGIDEVGEDESEFSIAFDDPIAIKASLFPSGEELQRRAAERAYAAEAKAAMVARHLTSAPYPLQPEQTPQPSPPPPLASASAPTPASFPHRRRQQRLAHMSDNDDSSSSHLPVMADNAAFLLRNLTPDALQSPTLGASPDVLDPTIPFSEQEQLEPQSLNPLSSSSHHTPIITSESLHLYKLSKESDDPSFDLEKPLDAEIRHVKEHRVFDRPATKPLSEQPEPNLSRRKFWIAGVVGLTVIVIVAAAMVLVSSGGSDGTGESGNTRAPILSRVELEEAIESYLSNSNGGPTSDAAKKYGYPIGTWNVSAVTDFQKLFSKRIVFNEDISDWDVSNALYTYEMFLDAYEFNQPIGKWSVSKVRIMADMFRGARAFNQPLDNWYLELQGSKARMDRMFSGATSFNQDLCSWGTWIPDNAQSYMEIFQGTSCPDTSDPTVYVRGGERTAGPLCHVCHEGI